MTKNPDGGEPSKSKFGPCPSCDGSGSVTAQKSGDWRRQPDRFRPDQSVPCRICGGTGLAPLPGTFDEV